MDMQILEGLYWYFQFAAAELPEVEDGVLELHSNLAELLLDLWDRVDQCHWEKWAWENENGYEYPMTWENDNGYEYPMTFLNYDPLDIINNNDASAAYSMSQDGSNHAEKTGIKQEMDSQPGQSGSKGGGRQHANYSFASNLSRTSVSSTSTITWSVPMSTPGKFHLLTLSLHIF